MSSAGLNQRSISGLVDDAEITARAVRLIRSRLVQPLCQAVRDKKSLGIQAVIIFQAVLRAKDQESVSKMVWQFCNAPNQTATFGGYSSFLGLVVSEAGAG